MGCTTSSGWDAQQGWNTPTLVSGKSKEALKGASVYKVLAARQAAPTQSVARLNLKASVMCGSRESGAPGLQSGPRWAGREQMRPSLAPDLTLTLRAGLGGSWECQGTKAWGFLKLRPLGVGAGGAGSKQSVSQEKRKQEESKVGA